MLRAKRKSDGQLVRPSFELDSDDAFTCRNNGNHQHRPKSSNSLRLHRTFAGDHPEAIVTTMSDLAAAFTRTLANHSATPPNKPTVSSQAPKQLRTQTTEKTGEIYS